MTKTELINQVFLHGKGISKEDAQRAVERIFITMTDSLSKGESIFYRGFGTLQVVQRAEKTVRNISKGYSYKIPPKKKAVLKPSKQLTELINANS